jgi:hypothetical protein
MEKDCTQKKQTHTSKYALDVFLFKVIIREKEEKKNVRDHPTTYPPTNNIYPKCARP